jgi:predicted nucleotidyltransferase component of viral defense system
MALSPTFFNQVRLLVGTMPQIFKEHCFGLKGGTAINLFVRDMPRLSVDIDLAYLPLEDRVTSLRGINSALRRIGDNVEKFLPGTRISFNTLRDTQHCTRLFVTGNDGMIKIEVTPVLRGSIHQPNTLGLSPSVEDQFGSAQMKVLNFADLYGGKICAALDRQHPRDLFDIHFLLKNEGLSEDLKNCFLVYLISHNRSIAEILDPTPLNIQGLYESEFSGMTIEPIDIEELYQARADLVSQIHYLLNDNDKAFLLSLKNGSPEWDTFAHPEAAQLPAVRWKLHNIALMQERKRSEALEKLEQVLHQGPTRIF